jgi:hypothetical protein
VPAGCIYVRATLALSATPCAQQAQRCCRSRSTAAAWAWRCTGAKPGSQAAAPCRMQLGMQRGRVGGARCSHPALPGAGRQRSQRAGIAGGWRIACVRGTYGTSTGTIVGRTSWLVRLQLLSWPRMPAASGLLAAAFCCWFLEKSWLPSQIPWLPCRAQSYGTVPV